MKRFSSVITTHLSGVPAASIVALEATRYAATRRRATSAKSAAAKRSTFSKVKSDAAVVVEAPVSEVKKPKKTYKVRKAWDYSEGYAKQMDADDVLAMPDDAPIEDTLEYLEQVTRTGSAEKHLREQMTMSMRMAAGECSPEVPSISFLYALLRKNPSLMHETYARRIRIAVEEWNRLSETRRATFSKNPLKGIVF